MVANGETPICTATDFLNSLQMEKTAWFSFGVYVEK
jgi:hypothetical protein